MKSGLTLPDLSAAILAQTNSKKDFVADTRKLTFNDDVSIGFEVGGGSRRFAVTDLCLEQIGQRVGIPAKYIDRMRTEAPGLLAKNVNHWFASNPEKRMLRTFDNGEKVARAFLSDKYRPLDNFDLAKSVLPKLSKAGCEVLSAQITEKRLYIQASTPKIQATLENPHQVGDVVQAGIVISNSEVGCGAVKVEPMIYRLVCKNGLISTGGLKKYHIGRAGEGNISGGDDTFEMLSDATRKLDDKAFWAKVCDVVDFSLNQIKFDATIQKLNDATRGELGKPTEIVEVTVDKFGLSEGEGENILEHLTRGGDLSKFGLVQAVTRSAEDCESYDRAIELERIGGFVLELPNSTWNN